MNGSPSTTDKAHLTLCQDGSDMVRVKKSKEVCRHYRLDEDHLSIVWPSEQKISSEARLAISSITEVRVGRCTETFKESKDSHSKELCFSVIYYKDDDYKTLDLVAPTAEVRTAWVEGLNTLLKEHAQRDKDTRSKVRYRWLQDIFDEADKDRSGSLDLKEIFSLMDQLNVGVSARLLKKKFKDADDGRSGGGKLDGKLDFQEFLTLYKDLASRPELQKLFKRYSTIKGWWRDVDLQRFLQLEQGVEDPSLEVCAQLIQKYESTDEGKAKCWMSLDGFTQFMLGPENDIINSDRSTRVYQDMTQPLSHYYIASSHNTYLEEKQLVGESSCEAYIRALRKGCRCVEIDCRNGPDGEPTIHHGPFTTEILFKDAIEAIKDHAFSVSEYPVILSIQIECSVPQQSRVAELMQEILGDMLYDAEHDETFPSPEDLKRKILIRGKKLKKDHGTEDENELSALFSRCVNLFKSPNIDIEKYDGVTSNSLKCWTTRSLSESSAAKLCSDSAEQFIQYNKHQISRVYPSLLRTGSSNFDPTPSWNSGCQLVALNYQTHGKGMDLNDGKFRDNGGCGYLLKPSIMRQELSRFDPNQENMFFSGFGMKIVRIQVISGQQLPKPGDKKGEVIDPYVVLQMVGADCDTQRVKTKTIWDNGFNPEWNETFYLHVKYPELAVLRIKVMDDDGAWNPDDFIGSYALPITCLAPGYRHVCLYKSGNKLETGTLFMHVQIQDLVAPIQSTKTKTVLKVKTNREYPVSLQTNYQGVDAHFCNIPGPLHKAVDLREDFTFALLHFKELVGQQPHASLKGCVELLISRAKNSKVTLQLEKVGESAETMVYRTSVKHAGNVAFYQMFEAFNSLNTAIQALLVHAATTAKELESIAKKAKECESDLMKYLMDNPTLGSNASHFAHTMFTVTTEASQLRDSREQAVTILKQIHSTFGLRN